MEREDILKFKGLVKIFNSDEKRWLYYGIGSKPYLTGADWIIEDSQYINKKDEVGTEIYEGDIVEYSEKPLNKRKPTLVRAVVIRDGCIFKLNPNPIRWGDLYLNLLANKVKVIGNINSNPELIKEVE